MVKRLLIEILATMNAVSLIVWFSLGCDNQPDGPKRSAIMRQSHKRNVCCTVCDEHSTLGSDEHSTLQINFADNVGVGSLEQ